MTYAEILEELQGMSNHELLSVHNKYCDANNCMDDYIYENGEYFLDEFFKDRPYELVCSIQYGDYNVRDDFAMFNGYGNLVSFNYIEDNVDLGDLADYIADLDEDEQEDFLYN